MVAYFLLTIPVGWLLVVAAIIGRDLWQHELARFGIGTRIVMLVVIFDAALFFLFTLYLLDRMRSLQ